MNGLTTKATAYVTAVTLTGAGLLAWSCYQMLHTLDTREAWLLGVLVLLGGAAQVRMVLGPTMQTSYNLGLVVYGFAFVTLGAPAAVIVAVSASMVEWAWHRYAWHTQAFNIGCLAIALSAGGPLYEWVVDGNLPTDMAGAAALLLAGLIFVFINHLMVGLAIRLAQGQSFSESGVFGRLTLLIDGTLLGVGGACALIWLINPYAAVIAAIPLYLISETLKVPALERQAATDPKTGLFNARYFQEAVSKELSRANRYGRPLTVVVGDLDHLRNVNNAYGHLAGDVVIAGVADVLRSSFRDYDVVARFGGEEFTILMPETSAEQAVPRVEALRVAIASARFEVSTSNTPLRITMSLGLAERDQPDDTLEAILHRADMAVYRSKLEGRNRLCVASGDTELPVGPPAVTSDSQADHGAVEAQPSDRGTDAHSQISTCAGPPDHDPDASDTARSDPPRGDTVSCDLTPNGDPATKADDTSRRVAAFVGTVAVAAVAALLLSALPPSTPDMTGLLLFAVICLLAESLSVDIYVRDTSVSTSAAPFIAGALLFGPVGVLVLSIVLSGAALLKHHSPINRFVFNSSVHLVAGLCCYWLGQAVGFTAADHALWLEAGLALASALILYAVTAGLVSVALSLSDGTAVRQTWRERFSWLAPHYVALGVVAYTLIFGYMYAGPSGVLVVVVPMLILRLGQKQYVGHTKELVAQLRSSNTELSTRADEVSRLNDDLLAALANAADLRDPHVLGHSQHVARYASLIAQELGLSPEQVDLVRRAGLLHDLGKLGIPEAILFKPGRLTPAEYAIVQQHSVLGGEILDTAEPLRSLVRIVRHHHERWDGMGYPDRLHGAAIPIESRILAVADTVEAMASNRPYRAGSSTPEILGEIEANAGTQFDPVVAAAFGQVLAREGHGVVVNSAVEPRTRTSFDVAAALSMACPSNGGNGHGGNGHNGNGCGRNGHGSRSTAATLASIGGAGSVTTPTEDTSPSPN